MPRTSNASRTRRAGWLVAMLALGTCGVAGAERSGWSATFSQGGKSVTMQVGSAAVLLEEGETVHPRVGAEGLRAVYGARVRLAASGRYRFGIEVEGGAAQLSVTSEARQALGEAVSAGGTAWTDWIPLGAGEVELVLSFQRDGAARARLRTWWEMQLGQGAGFPAEPLPASAARVWSGFEAGAARGDLELRGRVLLERKGCTSCHAPGAASSTAVGVRPGPALERVGERASVAWLERWIAAPSAIRPGADMPDLLGESVEELADAAAIAAFLASVARPESDPAPSDPDLARAGRTLYHRVGCVACHGALAAPAEILGEEYLSDEVPELAVSAPFGDLDGKWTVETLGAMLLDPLAVHPDGRMPSLLLSSSEAEALAHYLVGLFGDSAALREERGIELAPDRVERGRLAFAAQGCGACHELEAAGRLAVDHGPPLDLLDPTLGCLDPHDASAPRYDLTEDERAALALGLRFVQEAEGDPSPIDRARRTMELHDCASCHAIGGRGGVAEELRVYFTTDEEVDLGDEGRIPPHLTGVGAKLETAWLARVLAEGGRARPYMAARMPRFGSETVAGLAEALARAEGVAPRSDLAPPPSTDAMVLAGRELMGRGAMACVTCHVHGELPPAGTPGTDLTRFAERLRYEWFRSFLLDPARYKPGTRMPSFGSGGTSTVRSIQGGDMLRQIDSMWTYFQLGVHMPPPTELEQASSLQLAVGDRPRVFRGFLDEAGSRSIAVGFPVGTHYAFDAGAVRLVDAWRGAFLDASGAWANRGGNVSGGRGPVVWSAPPGPPLAMGPRPLIWPEAVGSEGGFRFRGYRVDERGVPVLLYSLRGARVSERVEPRVESGALVRSFHVTDIPAGALVWLRAGEEDRVVESFTAIGERVVPGRPSEDGFTWYGLEPRAGELRFRWEVAL